MANLKDRTHSDRARTELTTKVYTEEKKHVHVTSDQIILIPLHFTILKILFL